MSDLYCIVEPFLDFNDFISFVTEVEQDFVPPLLTRINLYDYFHKVSLYGEVIKCFVDNNLAGVAFMYANNQETRTGFITFIATRNEFRGMHVATTILEKCFIKAIENGMQYLNIETNNIAAKACYLKLGFVETSKKMINNSDLTRFYLTKKL